MVKWSDIVKYGLVAGILIGGGYFTLKYIVPEFKKLWEEVFGKKEEEEEEYYPEVPPPTYVPPPGVPAPPSPPPAPAPEEARVTVSQIYVFSE